MTRYEIYIDKVLRYTFFTIELFEDKLNELKNKGIKTTTRNINLN